MAKISPTSPPLLHQLKIILFIEFLPPSNVFNESSSDIFKGQRSLSEVGEFFSGRRTVRNVFTPLPSASSHALAFGPPVWRQILPPADFAVSNLVNYLFGVALSQNSVYRLQKIEV